MGGLSVENASSLVTAIASLMKSRNQIQEKYRQELPERLSHFHRDIEASNVEQDTIHHALHSGPGQLIGAELSESQHNESQSGQQLTKLRTDWLTAMERRELSLQILLVLEVLRISVEVPTLLSSEGLTLSLHSQSRHTAARDTTLESQCLTDTSQDVFGWDMTVSQMDSQAVPESQVPESQQATAGVESKPAKKRKRKSGTARRWTGFPTGLSFDASDDSSLGFPWEKRPSKPGDTGDTADGADQEERAEDALGPFVVCDPEKLHKRFESLADRLALRVAMADLSNDIGGDLLAEDEDARRTKRKPALFGTAARVREDQDEMDELRFFYTIIVDPRYVASLPRQCSTLRSRAGTSLPGSTPARPRASKSSTSVGLTGATDQQRHREGQQLSTTRKESDLVLKGKAAEAKAKARAEQRASQRPALKDALFAEETKQRKARASSIAADVERTKREVSVKNRVSWSRSISTSQAADHSQSQGANVAQSLPVMAFSTSSGAFNKRKTLEPQRFGGLFANTAAKKSSSSSLVGRGAGGSAEIMRKLPGPSPASTDVEDNPFLDRASVSASAPAPPKSSRIVVTETPRKPKRIRPKPVLPPSPSPSQLLPAAPTSTAARPTASWGRTESQPVSSRDLASLSVPLQRARVAVPVTASKNPFHPPAASKPSTTTAMTAAAATTGRNHLLSVPSTNAHIDTSNDPHAKRRRRNNGSRGSSRATSLALSVSEAEADEEVNTSVGCSSSSSAASTTSMSASASASASDSEDDDDEDEEGEESSSTQQPQPSPEIHANASDASDEEADEMLFFNPPRNARNTGPVQGPAGVRRPLHGLSGIANWVKGAGVGMGMEATKQPQPQQEREREASADPIEAYSANSNPFVRRPSGRNPFAKSASMQQVQL